MEIIVGVAILSLVAVVAILGGRTTTTIGGDFVGRDKSTTTYIINAASAAQRDALPVERGQVRLLLTRPRAFLVDALAILGLIADLVGLASVTVDENTPPWLILVAGAMAIAFTSWLAFRITLSLGPVPRRLPGSRSPTSGYIESTPEGIVIWKVENECPQCQVNGSPSSNLYVVRTKVDTETVKGRTKADGTKTDDDERDIYEDRLTCSAFPRQHRWAVDTREA